MVYTERMFIKVLFYCFFYVVKEEDVLLHISALFQQQQPSQHLHIIEQQQVVVFLREPSTTGSLAPGKKEWSPEEAIAFSNY
jgi:hypothetical protein